MPPHEGTNLMISLFAWNTRGFNKKRKHLYLRSWLQSAKPSFGCLIETRVQEGKSEAIVSSSLPGWKFLNNYDHHRLGKIWVCWSANVNVTVLYKSAQIITVWVVSDTGDQFLCSCVYASNFQTERQRLWSDLLQNNVQFASSGVPGSSWAILMKFSLLQSTLQLELGIKAA